MWTEWHKRMRGRRDHGAALVEFALVLPIFMALILGIFSGGQSYSRKLTITNGAREAARYAATLPVATTLNAWIDAVGDVAIQAATGQLDPGAPGRSLCVAFVYPGTAGSPPTATKTTTSKTVTGAGSFSSTSSGTTPCFADGRPNDEARVQVAVKRNGRIDLFLLPPLIPELRGQSVMRFERT